MKSIRIDFAPNSVRRNIGRIGPVTWLLGCVGVLLCASAAIAAVELLRQRDALLVDRRYSEVQLQKRVAPQTSPTKFVIAEAHASAVNGAIAQLNLPWKALFDAVEAATPATIALLSLEPDAKKQFIRGTAEAKGSDGMLAYIEQLKQQSFFTAVMLTRHEVNEQDPNKPIRFQFEAQWAGDVQ
jgi:Tfp pilus assembly protein PilN